MQATAVPHPALRGRERELALITFLNEHLPKKCAASSGYLLDPSGNLSSHLDVIIYDAMNSPIYRPSKDALILPSDNAATVIEVKSQLTEKTLKASMKQLSEVKHLGKSQSIEYVSNVDEETSCPGWERKPSPPGSIDTRTILFAYESQLSVEDIGDLFYRNYALFPPGTQIDYIFVLDHGMICLMIHDPKMSPSPNSYAPGIFPPWTSRSDPKSTLIILRPTPKGKKDDFEMVRIEGFVLQPDSAIAVGAINLGKHTLDAFFRTILIHIEEFRGWVTYPGGNWASNRAWIRPLGVAVDPSLADRIWKVAKMRFNDLGEFLFRKGPSDDTRK
jgi:hypothetical protein